MIVKDVVAFILRKDGKVLLEKRKLSKKYDPGAVCFPVGSIEKGENTEEALKREMYEELSAIPIKYSFLCTVTKDYFDHTARIHYFLIDSWEGTVRCNEADSLLWTELKKYNIKEKADSQAVEILLRRKI